MPSNAITFTGKVIALMPFITKSSSRNSSADSDTSLFTSTIHHTSETTTNYAEYGYLWVRVQTPDLEFKEFCVRSSEVLSELAVDDFISVVDFSTVLIPSDEGTPGFVSSRRLANVVIQHSSQRGAYIDNSLSTPPSDFRVPKPGLFSYLFLSALFVAFVSWSGLYIFTEVVFGTPLVIGLIFLFRAMKLNRYKSYDREYQAELAAHRERQVSLNDLGSLDTARMGLTTELRERNDSLIQCRSCDCFSPSELKHCVSCGEQLLEPLVQNIAECTSAVDGSELVQSESTVEAVGSKSLKAVKDEVFKETFFTMSSDVQLNQFLWPNSKYSVNAALVVGEVVSLYVTEDVKHHRTTKTNESVKRREKTTFYTDGSYDYDVKDIATYKNTTTKNSRTVSQSVTMVIELMDGTRFDIAVPKSSLQETKKGHWASLELVELAWGKKGSNKFISKVSNVTTGRHITTVTPKYDFGTVTLGAWLLGIPVLGGLSLFLWASLSEGVLSFSAIFAAMMFGVYYFISKKLSKRKEEHLSLVADVFKPLDDKTGEVSSDSSVRDKLSLLSIS